MESNNDVAPANQPSTEPTPPLSGLVSSTASPFVELSIPLIGVTAHCKPTTPTPALHYAKPLPDVSKIEVFEGKNFKRWQERVYSILDMHSMAWALTDVKTDANSETWTQANKVCRHTILSTLGNDLFDVYCAYKEAKAIWDSMITKYTAEDAGKQKFVIGNFYKWEMTGDKDIKVQVNEYHKLLEDLRAENINLQEDFTAGVLIKKLPNSWNDYKN